jgi:hypothetical protein
MMEITKIMYIDCKQSGISGDLFLSAISQFQKDDSIFIKMIQLLKDEFLDVKIQKAAFQDVEKNGLFPKKLVLEFEENQHHSNIEIMHKKIKSVNQKLGLSQQAIKFSTRFLDIIAEAESQVHKISVKKIHLHEIGSIDTVIDICGITAFLDKMGVFNVTKDNSLKIVCSPVAVGGGTVKISHGVVSIPAPATAKILEKYKIPFQGGPVEKELCTPTGAAILGSLIENCNLQFSQFIPPIKLEKLAQSTGNLIVEGFPNILNIYFGNDHASIELKKSPDLMIKSHLEKVAVVETTVDDVTGERIGHMMDLLLKEGALDVNFIPVQSKKNRPATLIRVITPPANVESISSLLINNLGTLGVRFHIDNRLCLKRNIIEKTATIFGKKVSYRVKVAMDYDNPEKIIHYKIEYEDLASISKEMGKSLFEINKLLEIDFLK